MSTEATCLASMNVSCPHLSEQTLAQSRLNVRNHTSTVFGFQTFRSVLALRLDRAVHERAYKAPPAGAGVVSGGPGVPGAASELSAPERRVPHLQAAPAPPRPPLRLPPPERGEAAGPARAIDGSLQTVKHLQPRSLRTFCA